MKTNNDLLHMSKILKLEIITDIKLVSVIRKLFHTIDVQVISLKNLRYHPDIHGLLPIPIISTSNCMALRAINNKFDEW